MGIRYETKPGEQAQLDWKESIRYEIKDGEIVYVNIAVLLPPYSRFRAFHLSVSKSQSVLLSFMTEVFETVPKVIVTDKMKTVMDEARIDYFKGVVNNKFAQYAQDFGFKVQPCVAGRPRTKRKVEAPMKMLDEINAYQGKFNYEDFMHSYRSSVHELIKRQVRYHYLHINKQEKNLLFPLPHAKVKESNTHL